MKTRFKNPRVASSLLCPQTPKQTAFKSLQSYNITRTGEGLNGKPENATPTPREAGGRSKHWGRGLRASILRRCRETTCGFPIRGPPCVLGVPTGISPELARLQAPGGRDRVPRPSPARSGRPELGSGGRSLSSAGGRLRAQTRPPPPPGSRRAGWGGGRGGGCGPLDAGSGVFPGRQLCVLGHYDFGAGAQRGSPCR